MKKVKLKEDVNFVGWTTLKKGTILKSEKFNSRYVYVELAGKQLRIPRSSVEIAN